MSIRVDVSDCRAGAEPRVFERGNNVVSRVSVAHNEQVADESGNLRPSTRWLQVVGFGDEARFLAENVHKGSALEIQGGELRYGRPYTDKAGVERTPDELHVIPGRGTIKLKDAIGARPDQADEPKPAA